VFDLESKTDYKIISKTRVLTRPTHKTIAHPPRGCSLSYVRVNKVVIHPPRLKLEGQFTSQQLLKFQRFTAVEYESLPLFMKKKRAPRRRSVRGSHSLWETRPPLESQVSSVSVSTSCPPSRELAAAAHSSQLPESGRRGYTALSGRPGRGRAMP
jgi:hypothetical protein